ncbi:MAG: DNA internalization-related competence protein ComEC/Rec2 [Gammaproteobacteria bacterium]|nr:DNA internalization-related competence protein ComEC/Rec2 [Gammaproteobacteria bacterium]
MTGSPPPFTVTITTFAAGVLASALLQDAGIFAPGAGVLFTAALTLAIAAIRWPVALLAAALAAGMGWFALQAGEVRASRLAEHLGGRDVFVTGVVADFPQYGRGRARFLFRPLSAHHGGAAIAHPHLLSLRDYDGGSYRQGETWRLRLRLRPPFGARNPAGHDRERWMFLRGIGGGGYVVADQRNQLLRAPPAWNIVPQWRARVLAGVRKLLAESPHRGMVEALAVGVRESLGRAQWEVLRAGGTAHLVAISGLHIGLVAGLGFVLAGVLWRLAVVFGPRRFFGGRPPRRWHCCLPVALAFALFYAALAGFSLPTQRALVMLIAFTATRLLDRRTGLFYGLAVALFGVLLLDPLPVLTAGFWLSFVAVAVIGLALVNAPPLSMVPVVDSPTMTARFAHWLRLNVRLAVRVQVALALAMAPALLLFFQQAPPLAPLVNLVVVPWFGITVVPAVLFAAVALLVDATSAAAALLAAAEGAVAVAWPVMAGAAALPLVALPKPSPWTLAAAAVAVFLLLGARKMPGRWLALVFAAPLVFGAPPPPLEGAVRVTVLDAGQGLAVLVRTRRHSLLYDAGPAYPGFDAGARVVAPSLRALGVAWLDALVLSHGDRDHAGGAAAVTRAFRPARVLSGEAGRFAGAVACVDGQRWTWDGVTFTFLAPPPGAADNPNNASCVLQVAGAGGAVLLTGDIERAAERALLARHRHRLRAAAVLVPHHGSRTSSSPAFVAAVGAPVAIVSAARHSHHGHPHPQVVARYRRAGSEVWNTAEEGAVTLTLAADGALAVTSERQRRPGLWGK